MSSLSVFPHSLAYFKEFAGGPQNGSAHVSDCNIDWGQDLFELKHWCEAHPEAAPLFVAYHGEMDPRRCGIPVRFPRPSTAATGQPPLWEPGNYAISVHVLRGGIAHLHDEQGRFRYSQQPEIVRRFLTETLVARAGYSILIFRLGEASAEPTGEQRSWPQRS